MSEQLEWVEDTPGEFTARGLKITSVLWIVGVDTDGLWCLESFNTKPRFGERSGKFWGTFGTRVAAQDEALRIDLERVTV